MGGRARQETADPPEVFVERELESAEQLLDELLPHRGGLLWNDYPEGRRWLFRGQMDADWGLSPAAMREGALFKYTPEQVAIPPRASLSVAQRMSRELDMVVRFIEHADTFGFSIPHDSPALRVGQGFDIARFPEPHLQAAFALAQHYGVPTRLLDWTTMPLVGAYFACDLAAEFRVRHFRPRRLLPEKAPRRIAVWALSKRAIVDLTVSQDVAVKFVTAPSAQIPNLHAQRGLFSLVTFGSEDRANSEDPPNLDELVRSIHVPKDDRWAFCPVLAKFTLPIEQAGRLLYQLSLLGVSAASIYPALASVEMQLFEENLHCRS